MKKKIIGIFVCTLLITTTLTATSAINFKTNGLIEENSYSKLNQNTPTSPGIITINIIAKIKSVHDSHNLLGGVIKVNDTIKGKYTYDSSATDSNPDPNLGEYWYNSSNFKIEFKVGGFVFKTNQSSINGLIFIGNNCSLYYINQDIYILVSYNNSNLSNGMKVNVIGWRLDDLTATVLSNDSLPTTAPVLSDWTQTGVGLIIWGSDPSDPDKTYEILADVTKATKSRTRDSYFTIQPILIWLLERYQNIFPMLRHLVKQY